MSILHVMELPDARASRIKFNKAKSCEQELIENTEMNINRIKYLPHKDIDKHKWDTCIKEAANGVVYANSFYLDGMSRHWDALVLDDYEAVMPLTWNKKYGFYYLYQPYFLPSLGLVGNNITTSTVLQFLGAIPSKFRFWDIDLNESNSFTADRNDLPFHTRNRVNHFLNLSKPYHEIFTGYKRLCQRMIKKALEHQVQIVRTGRPVDVIEFYIKHYKDQHPKIKSSDYSKLVSTTTGLYEKDMAKVYLAQLPGGEITAVYLVLVDENFVYSLIGGSSEVGKSMGSFYLVTDAAIKDHAGSAKVFRFEGSDRKGIAFFNSQFGAQASSYLHITSNTLPFPVNLLKRS